MVTGRAPGAAVITVSVEDRSASAAIEVKEGAMVGSSGAELSLFGGTVAIVIPAGALAVATPIAVEPAESPPQDPALVSGTAFTFGPEGTVFGSPARLTLRYSPETFAGAEADLAIRKAVDGAWVELPGSVVDVGANAVSAPLAGFSTYAIVGSGSAFNDLIVYHSGHPSGDGEDLYTVGPGGTGVRRLGFHSGEIDDPAWAWDRGRIAFAAKPPDPNSEEYDIYTIGPNGSGPVNLTNTPTLNEYDPAWSPDGARIAFTDDDSNLWVMDADGRNTHQILGQETDGPDWSPDGSRILFTNDNLFVVDADGSGLKQLTAFGTGFVARDPSWSPDGSRILFEGTTLTETTVQRGIYTVDASGGDLRTVLTGADNPVWSPDGSRIAFVDDGGGIFTIDAGGGGRTLVVADTSPEHIAWR
jgi:Tol biopolymer transport system component